MVIPITAEEACSVSVEERLKSLGVVIPSPAKPVAAYVPAVVAGKWVYISGQLPFKDGKLGKTGKVGKDLTTEEAYVEARQSAINCLAALKDAVRDLDKVARIVKVTGFVAVAEGYTDPPKVVNGASEFLGQVFGDEGKHARSAVGVAELPMGAPCEVELIALLK